MMAPAYLNYTMGKLMIRKLRDDCVSVRVYGIRSDRSECALYLWDVVRGFQETLAEHRPHGK
jgi:hypothetical protein